VSDDVPLQERIARYRQCNPDAGVPEVAGAVGESPTAVHEVLNAEPPETGQESSKDAGDRVRGSRSRSCTGPDDEPVTRFSAWAEAEFGAPKSGIYPTDMHEREQWMGHREKKPFAPWRDRDHPAADGDEDARWKWGITDNYVDGPTVAMAEDDPRIDGRAYLQMEDDPYVYVDGDDVRCPETGDVHRAFLAIVEHLGLTYADISQSGSGVHAIYRGDLPDGVTQAKWRLDESPWGANDDRPSIEIYAGKRVCVMTGDHIPGTPTQTNAWDDDVLDALLEANDEVAASNREHEQERYVSTDRGDYDLEDHDAAATSSDETTDDIRDVFAALDRLNAQQVADCTIVARWNDHASTSDGERAFWPTWGSVSSDSGTANIVNSERWLDTGDMGGYGGPVVMALIDAGEMQPSRASPKRATGELWWRGIDHLRELGFDIPKYEPMSAPESHTPNGGYTVEHCEPPEFETTEFNRYEHWNHLQSDRYDETLDHDGPVVWRDPAGSGKTTNAVIAALQRERPTAALFDKHEKAREFILDDALPDWYDPFHLKGGEQRREGVCMDADHAGEDCPEHGDSSNCPSMCPVYDLDAEDDVRLLYEAVAQELGDVKAHLLLGDELPGHDEDGYCTWTHQFERLESVDHVVGVHEYQTLKTVREGRDIIVDESPSSLRSTDRISVEELVRVANALDEYAACISRTDPTQYTAQRLASFVRDVVDAITDSSETDLEDLDVPTPVWDAYESHDDAAGHYIERVEPDDGWQIAEALAQLKVGYTEMLISRIRRDEWSGTPLCMDAVLTAVSEAGLPAGPVMKAVATPTALDDCPRCGGPLDIHDGKRCCDSCGWDEDDTLTSATGEQARSSARLDVGGHQADSLVCEELPLQGDLPGKPLILDATATPFKIARLYGVEPADIAVLGDCQFEANMHVSQVLDGQYHGSTILDGMTDDGGERRPRDEWSGAADRIQTTIDQAGNLYEQPLFVLKKGLKALFDFPDNAVVLHYHATRGLNREESDAVFCIGAPHPDVEDLKREAELLAMGTDSRVGGTEHSTRGDAPDPPVYRKLNFQDESGRGRAVPTKHYTGLVGDLFRETREKEIEQAIHRARPLLADDQVEVYLLTNVPTSTPIDEVCSFEELADPLNVVLPVPEGAVDLLEAVHDAAAGDCSDGFRTEDLVERHSDGSLANKVAGYHRLARLSGIDVSQRTIYNWVNSLEEIGLLQPEEYEQHAGITYSTDFATLKQALSVLSSSPDFKVAAVRRLRRLVAESDGGLSWLDRARDLLNLHSGPEVSATLRDDGGKTPY